MGLRVTIGNRQSGQALVCLKCECVRACTRPPLLLRFALAVVAGTDGVCTESDVETPIWNTQSRCGDESAREHGRPQSLTTPD